MKTIAKILAVIAAAACMAVVGIGCGPKGYVDKSNAVELGAFDRPDYAREMEEKHDREGREHIEIPDGAETITIDGEEYIPISDLDEVKSLNKNYIMKNDIYIERSKRIGSWQSTFSGKFHGNNYKIKGKNVSTLFGRIEDAKISNIIFSADYEPDLNGAILVDRALNSVISGCINYSKPKNRIDGLVSRMYCGTVENCINYADMASSSGLICEARFGFAIRDCANYGNISGGNEFCGGILAEYYPLYYPFFIKDHAPGYAQASIENCINEGKIIGGAMIGGLVGGLTTYYDILKILRDLENDVPKVETTVIKEAKNYDEGVPKQDFLVIENCRNEGDIYREKSKEIERQRLSGIGGIVGIGSVVRNCTNNGSIYGYEILPRDKSVNKIGGVAGGAYIVEDCTSTTQLKLADNVVQYGDICGFLAKD